MINYYLLIKPGIILGNLITFAAGFFLASRGGFDLWLFAATLSGLALIIASACVFNNYIDRHVDREMSRTKKRALATGAVSHSSALIYGAVLGLAGNAVLYANTNLLTTLVADVGFFIYVCVYSFIKTQTSLSTLIGSIAGAIPPLVGYCAVSNRLDLAALLLFLMLVFWQMPHFFAIGIWHREDYSKANLPILPVVKGIQKTKIHMVAYLLLLIPVLYLMTMMGYTGQLFFIVTGLLGTVWLALCLLGFYANNDKLWGRQMFRVSLVMINVICLLIYFDQGAQYAV